MTTTGVPSSQDHGRRWGAGRVLLAVSLAAVAAMWIYAFSGLAGRDHPDRFDYREFAAEAEATCAAAIDRLDALPIVTHESPTDELARVVDQANGELRGMVDDLRAAAPASGPDAELLQRWLADWDTYLRDRDDWVERVRQGEVGPLTETERAGEPISRGIDNLAVVNDMPSCQAP